MKIGFHKRTIGIVLVVVLLLVLIGYVIFQKLAFQVQVENMVLDVGETFDNQFRATFWGKDVTDQVTVQQNVFNTRVGDYEVTYIYHDGKHVYKDVKVIKIKDRVAPDLKLQGGNEVTVLKGSNYREFGYVAIDNCDGDVTEKVKVEGKVDVSVSGEYLVTYSVMDSSKNKTQVKRKVRVVDESPLSMGLADFSLDGFYSQVQLGETEDMGEDYTNGFIFAGDSMALYYVINKLVPGSRLWHRESLDPETALSNTIYINHQDLGLTMVETFQKYQPERVILTLGTNSAAYMKPEYFIDQYKKLIREIQKVSPNTRLIIQAIPPIDGKYDLEESGINNTKINHLNYYILEMCNELDVKFLNSAVAMKDENGQCKVGYCLESDGIHPTVAGGEALMKYAQTHAWID